RPEAERRHEGRGRRWLPGEVRIDRKECADHRKRKGGGRTDREARQDEARKRGDDGGPCGIRAVEVPPYRSVDSRYRDGQENRRIRPEVLFHGLAKREHEERDGGRDEDQRAEVDRLPCRGPPRRCTLREGPEHSSGQED